jgi:beta-aspartyl-peptidase (threonine type)
MGLLSTLQKPFYNLQQTKGSIVGMKRFFFIIISLLITQCQTNTPSAPSQVAEFAIAIHGGAGVISKDIDPELKRAYEESLAKALQLGHDRLKRGDSALDVVEAVVRVLEDDSLFNAGKGAVYTHTGEHELDASIMDGATLGCGAVTGVKTVKNPVSLARLVMEKSNHVFFSGDGAEAFADLMQVERVDNSYFNTVNRYLQLQRALEREKNNPQAGWVQHKTMDTRIAFDEYKMGTVGAVALDKSGNLAAATSTGGMTNKKHGRIGDAPVIGAGNYANNLSAAISATGSGEEFIRNVVARDIAAYMEYKEATLKEAAEFVIHKKLKPGDGGIISVDKYGNIALVFNSEGMFRGAADSNGRFDVKIWEN